MLKKKFSVALALAGIKQNEYARRHSMTEPALSQLINGKMKSKRHMKHVLDFIKVEFKKQRLANEVVLTDAA